MAKLFDKITGTSTSFEADGITNNLANYKENQFEND